MSELVFLLGADADIQAAFEFYDQLQPGRGEMFMRHLDIAVTRLRSFPESAPTFHRNYRRLLVPGFPYGVFYSVEGSRIIIAAVLGLRQEPATILKRLGG